MQNTELQLAYIKYVIKYSNKVKTPLKKLMQNRILYYHVLFV